MLTRIFGQINSATSIMLVLYTLLLGAGYVYFNPAQDFTVQTAAGRVLLYPVVGWAILSIGVLLLMLVYQWLFYAQYKLVKHHALVPFVLPVLVLLTLGNQPLFGLLISLALALLFRLWFAVYQGDRLLSNALNTGFLLGIGALFSPAFTILLPFTWFVYIIYGRLNARTFIIPVIGYFTIWIDVLALDYLLADSTFIWRNFMNQFTVAATDWQSILYPLLLFGVLLLPGLAEFTVTFNRANVFKRQTFVLFILLLVIAVLCYLFGGVALFPLVMLAPIVSVLFVNYLQYVKRNWLRELFMWLLIAVFILLQQNWL